MEKRRFYREARRDLPGPLAGLRVLEIATTWAGPMCACLLADFGADVIKVEHPEGDVARRSPPMLPGTDPPASFMHATVNRNKRSLTLDVRRAEGRELFLRLAARSDVVVESFRPGVADAFGIGFEAVRGVRPAVVYVSISGFGQFGPDHSRPGYDPLAQAASGFLSLNGDPAGPPVKAPTFLGDDLAGLHAALACLAALRHRDASGEGQHVDVSLLDAMLYQSTGFLTLGALGVDLPRLGNEFRIAAPANCYRARDGFVVAGALLDSQWRRLVVLLGRPELGDHPDFATTRARLARRRRRGARALPGGSPRCGGAQLRPGRAGPARSGARHAPGGPPRRKGRARGRPRGEALAHAHARAQRRPGARCPHGRDPARSRDRGRGGAAPARGRRAVKPSIHLYGPAGAPFTEKVVRALCLKRLAYEHHEPESTEDYRRWNPETGLLPLLEIDGERVADSTAILLRLDERFPDPPLLASDPRTAAAQRRLEEWADESFFWYWLRWQRLRPEGLSGPPTRGALADAPPDPAPPASPGGLRERLRRRFRPVQAAPRSDAAAIGAELDQRLRDLERLLAHRPFFYAERVSMADLAVFAMLRSLAADSIPGGAVLLARRRELVAYVRRVEEATTGG
jgi:formyl-CoA transferase